MNAWPRARKWLWAFVATLVVIAQGPLFLHSIRVTWAEGNDFFQDWASARNVIEGYPAYLPLSEAISRYYPQAEKRSVPKAYLPWNAHPPTSVLATVPLALMDYPEAGILWNVLGLLALVVSLGLITRELNLPVPTWSVVPIATVALLCSPIRTQVAQGQWNALLLLLLTLAWAADRRGWNLSAGLWVGTAVTLKLFPIFLLLYFATRRRWGAIIAGSLWAGALSLITVAVLGLDAYRDYLSRVLPTLQQFRYGWSNASLPAFWTKNFAAGASHYGLYIGPLIQAPLLARTGMVMSWALVLATTFYFVNRSRCFSANKLVYGDLCYALTMVAMLLLTPICWDHYLLLMALPLALIWVGLDPSNLQRLAFMVLVTAVWVGPSELWRLRGVDLQAAWPDFQSVPPKTYVLHRSYFVPVFLSVHFYALLASFLWLSLLANREMAGSKYLSGRPWAFTVGLVRLPASKPTNQPGA
jgi:hypothetical protein